MRKIIIGLILFLSSPSIVFSSEYTDQKVDDIIQIMDDYRNFDTLDSQDIENDQFLKTQMRDRLTALVQGILDEE